MQKLKLWILDADAIIDFFRMDVFDKLVERRKIRVKMSLTNLMEFKKEEEEMDEYNDLLGRAVKATYGPSDLEQEAREVLDETGLTPRELQTEIKKLKAERDELRGEIMLFLNTFRYAADELQALAGKEADNG